MTTKVFAHKHNGCIAAVVIDGSSVQVFQGQSFVGSDGPMGPRDVPEFRNLKPWRGFWKPKKKAVGSAACFATALQHAMGQALTEASRVQ